MLSIEICHANMNIIIDYWKAFSNWADSILNPIHPRCKKCDHEITYSYELGLDRRHECEPIMRIYETSKLYKMDTLLEEIYYRNISWDFNTRCIPIDERFHNDSMVCAIRRNGNCYYCLSCYANCKSSLMKSCDNSKKML